MKANQNPEYFLAVATERNISKAAEKLHISQPYLSQHIIRLEKSLQVRLLDREKTPLCLTPAGEIYANYLESCRQLYQKLLFDLEAVGVSRIQTLRLGFSHWRASTVLPDILPAFTRQYPAVKLEFFELPTSGLYDLITEGKVDFVIVNSTLDTPDYVTTETIFYEKILLVGHKDNPLTAAFLQMQGEGLPMDLRLLEDERMILLRPELAMAKRINNYLDKKQIVLRHPTYTTSASIALNLTAQNYGFCFVNETGVRCAPNREELVFFDLDSDDLTHPLCVVYKKNSYLTPLARAFIDIMIDFYHLSD